MTIHISLLLLGFAMSWLGVWAALDIRLAGRDPAGSDTDAPLLPAAAALGAGLWAGSVVFALATGRPVQQSIGVGALVLDSLVGLLATWLAVALTHRGGRWAAPLAALGIGAAIALRHALPGLAALADPELPEQFLAQTLLAAWVVWLGILGSARIDRERGGSEDGRRVLQALVLGTALGAAELILVVGPFARSLPAFTPAAQLLDLRLRIVLPALVVAGILAFVDIQLRRQQGQQWRRFRTLVEESLDLVLVVRADRTLGYVSPSIEPLLGYPVGVLRQAPLARIVHPDDLAALPCPDDIIRRGGQSCHAAARLRRAGNVWRRFEGTAALRNAGEVVLHLVDVTERRAAERAATAMARRNEQVLRTLGEGVFGLDARGAVTYANEAGLAMIGLALQEVAGQPLEAVMRRTAGEESFALRVTAAVRGAFATMETQRGYGAALLCRDGRELTLDYTVTPAYEADGEPSGAVALFVDVSQRRRDEEGKRRLAQQFVAAMELLVDAVVVEDATGRVAYVNRSAHAMLGLEVGDQDAPGELLYGKLRCGTWDGTPLASGEGPIAAAMRRGEAVGPVERTYTLPDGRVLYCLVEAVPWQEQEGPPGVLYAVHDVTENHRVQEERLRTRRIEALGVFAGGIAHDFNNQLTVVLGNLALARSEIQAGSEADNLLQSAGRACEQAAGLTRQLLTFSRGGAPVTRSVALGAVIEDALAHLLQDGRISARSSLPQDLWRVEADADQIRQVITNIVRNAIEAMPQGGVVDVAAGNVRLSPGEVPPLAGGRYVHVTIADHGQGIAPQHLDRIFEPYFTTKPRGHGLGLATCWSIVRRHGGQITADSTVGEGASLHVYLPQARSTGASVPAMRGGFVQPRRVLLMDDEREILAVSGEMLRRLGHQVTIARDGDGAVAACREALAAGLPIEVAVLDLTIPGGMGGREACRQLRQMDEAIGAIASSGYSNDAVMGDFGSFGFQAVLPKPYRLDELQAAVESAIASAHDLRERIEDAPREPYALSPARDAGG